MPLYSHPAEIRDNGQASSTYGHTEYREMAFRLDGSNRNCSDNTITRKMSSANYRDSIAIVKSTIDSLL